MIDADRRTLQRIKRLEDRLALVRRTASTTGTAFQPLDAELSALAALNSAADQLPYFDGVDSAALTPLTDTGRSLIGLDGTMDKFPFFPADGQAGQAVVTPFARSLLDDPDATTAQTTLDGVNIFRPERYGAKGDGVTDDTVALQACIDAAMAASVNPAIIKLRPGVTYLVNRAPRTDRGGNSILSVIEGGIGTKSLVFDGGEGPAVALGGKTTIKTTRTSDTIFPGPSAALTADLNSGDTTAHIASTVDWPTSGGFYCQRSAYTYTAKTSTTLTGVALVSGQDVSHLAGADDLYFTYGPPSVIGGKTDENGWSGSFEVTGPIAFRNLVISVPLDPAIAGIDAISWGGIDLDKSVEVRAPGTLAALPSTKSAFGIRYPGSFGFGYYRTGAQVYQMYAGHVLRTTDHLRFDHAIAYNCTLGLGLQDGAGGAPSPTRQHPVGGGYISIVHCDTYIGGWNPTAGAVSATPRSDGAETAFFGDLVVDTETGPAPFDGTTIILDADDVIGGHIHVHHFTGLGVGSSVGNITGARNLGVTNLRRAIPIVASASSLDLSNYRGNGIVHVTGDVTINCVSILPQGEPMTLWLTGAATVTHDATPPAGYAAVELAEGVDFSGSAQRMLTIVYTGSDEFHEIGRKRSVGWQAWTPTTAGWAADPTGPTSSVYRYHQVGKKITLAIRQQNLATSNATTKTLTLPVTAATITNMLWEAPTTFVDSGTTGTTSGMAQITSAATTVSFFTNWASAAWTASGNCRIAACTITYESA